MMRAIRGAGREIGRIAVVAIAAFAIGLWVGMTNQGSNAPLDNYDLQMRVRVLERAVYNGGLWPAGYPVPEYLKENKKNLP